MANKYQRFGLRADKNLLDVPNPTAALNNILEDLTISSSDKFSSSDLLVIKDLKDTRVDLAKLSQINDILPAYTPNGGGDNKPALPFVTIKDQIENFKVIAGEPPFLSGGSGPLAHKYNSNCLGSRYDAINGTAGNQAFGSSSSWSDPGVGVSVVEEVRVNQNDEDSIVQGPLDFWQTGEFKQSSKLHPSFLDQYGAVIWEGWTSIEGFQLDSNGCLLIEQDVFGLGEWETIAAVPYYRTRYNSGFSIVVNSEEGTTTITMSGYANQPKSFFEGMRVYLEGGGVLRNPDGNIIAEVTNDGNDRIVRIDEDLSEFNFSISAIHFGWDPTADTYRTDSLAFDQRYTGLYTRYKIAWFYPKIKNTSYLPFKSAGLDNKEFEMRFGEQDLIEYWYFYPEDPALTGGRKYSYEQFLTERISNNVRVSTNDINSSESMFFNYTPKTSFSDITPSSNITNLSQIDRNATNIPNKRLLVSTGYNFRSSLNQGDYLLYRDSANAYTCAQIYRFDRTETHVYVDPDPDIEYGGLSSSNTAMTAIKRDGLVGIYYATTVSDDSIGRWIGISETNSLIKGQTFNPLDIGKDMVVFAYSHGTGGVSQYGVPQIVKRPRGYDPANNSRVAEFYIEPLVSGTSALATNTSYIIAVYASKGLHDNTSPQQCLGVLAAEVIDHFWYNSIGSGPGLHQIEIRENPATLGIQVGDYIQFGSDPDSETYVSEEAPDGTTIGAIEGNLITLSFPDSESHPLIPINATAVFIKAANYVSGVSKEFCIVPLNTAPPFESTNEGLQTPTGYGLEAVDVEFRELKITLNGSGIAETQEINGDGYLPLFHGDTKYKLLTVD
jgi:hypothetical protein